MKLIWCNGFPEIYARLEEGMGSICHGYMCIVLYIYMKLMWCNGFAQIYVRLGVHLPNMWCNGFPKIYAGFEGVPDLSVDLPSLM